MDHAASSKGAMHAGLALVANMEQRDALAATVAAAHLLHHCSELAAVLLQLGALQRLAAAALQEASLTVPRASLQGAMLSCRSRQSGSRVRLCDMRRPATRPCESLLQHIVLIKAGGTAWS